MQLTASRASLLQVHGVVGSKADEGTLRDIERRLAGVARTAEHASEGVRALTQSTSQRVDEHASAIQRLTLVSNQYWYWQPRTADILADRCIQLAGHVPTCNRQCTDRWQGGLRVAMSVNLDCLLPCSGHQQPHGGAAHTVHSQEHDRGEREAG
jgi:hypothetical protein